MTVFWQLNHVAKLQTDHLSTDDVGWL